MFIHHRSCIRVVYALFVQCMVVLGADAAQNNPVVYGAYVMLAPAADGSTLMYARAVVDGSTSACPKLISSEGEVLLMQPRGMHPDDANKTSNFLVTVCEVIIKEGTAYNDSTDQINLRPMTLSPKQILVYGDTGCEEKNCPLGEPAKQFEALIKQGLKEKPELLLHMGDGNYRGTSGAISGEVYAYDAGDGGYGGLSCAYTSTYTSQNSKGSPRPDTWSNWNDDFFEPAKSMLSSAPWVFARGNHELCSRAGLGWFYFFGPGSSLKGGVAQMQCPDQGDYAKPPTTAAGHIAMIPPYFVDLGYQRLWVLDTANACDAGSDNPLTDEYQTQFEQLQASAKVGETIWMMTHRPLWGVNSIDGPSVSNVMLQTALSKTPAKALPSAVSLSLSGHMHVYQSLTFPPVSTRPAQIIIGNSGVTLSTGAPVGDFGELEVDGQGALGEGLALHGFLSMKTKTKGRWKGEILDEKGNTLVRCDSKYVARGERICKIKVKSKSFLPF